MDRIIQRSPKASIQRIIQQISPGQKGSPIKKNPLSKSPTADDLRDARPYSSAGGSPWEDSRITGKIGSLPNSRPQTSGVVQAGSPPAAGRPMSEIDRVYPCDKKRKQVWYPWASQTSASLDLANKELANDYTEPPTLKSPRLSLVRMRLDREETALENSRRIGHVRSARVSISSQKKKRAAREDAKLLKRPGDPVSTSSEEEEVWSPTTQRKLTAQRDGAKEARDINKELMSRIKSYDRGSRIMLGPPEDSAESGRAGDMSAASIDQIGSGDGQGRRSQKKQLDRGDAMNSSVDEIGANSDLFGVARDMKKKVRRDMHLNSPMW